MPKSKYNPEIDFWKLVFAVAIFLFHSSKFITSSGWSLFNRGYLAVEFFFIVSGYFLAMTIREKEDDAAQNSCWVYLLHKIKAFYLYYFCAFIISFTVRQWILSADVITVIKNFLLSWNEIFLLKMGGITSGRYYNGPTWYISAMLIAMAVLYPLAKKWKTYFLNIGALLISICGYALISQYSNSLNVAEEWQGIIYLGVIRAVAGVSLGIFCNECCEQIKRKGLRTTALGKSIFLVLEIILIISLFGIMNFTEYLNLNRYFDYVSLFLFFIFTVILFSGLTGIKEKLKKPGIFKMFSRFSLLLYLNHRIVVYYLNYITTDMEAEWSYRHYMFYYVIGTLLMIFCCWGLSRIVRFVGVKFGSKIKSKMFKESLRN